MISNALTLSTAQLVIEAAAILAFAISGLLEAARKKLDAVGVCIVVGLSAFGGGTLRDILLDRRPFFWVEHSVWLWVLLALSVLAMFFLQARHFALTERAMQWPDAIGLGLFTAGGTQLAIAASMPAIVAVLMGMITAVFGGVLRDIVCNEIPQAFRDHRKRPALPPVKRLRCGASSWFSRGGRDGQGRGTGGALATACGGVAGERRHSEGVL